MKSVIKIEKLDLIGLMKESLENNEFVSYPYGVHWGTLGDKNEIKYLEGVENDELTMGEDFKLEGTLEYLKKDKNNYAFVNFSNVNIGEPISCMDGNSYGNDVDEEDVEEYEQVEETGVEMLDDGSNFGYIIQYKDGAYTVNSGIYSLSLINCMIPPTESVEIVEDCLLFEKPMERYLERFIIE